jgi:hypothetical protein
MNCREVREILSAYLEKEVSQTVASKIEAHLAECENCRLLTEELKALNKSLSSLPELEPSPALLARLYSIPGQVELQINPAAREPEKVSIFSRKFWLSPAFQPLLVSLTVILIVASLVFFTQPGRNFQKSISLELHRAYSQAQRVLVKAGVITDRLNGYRESLLASLGSDQRPKSDQN